MEIPNLMTEQYKQAKHLIESSDDIKVYSYFYDVIIITDARLIDEIETVKDNFECITIRVQNSLDNKLTYEQKNHITETNLDEYDKFDYIIENNEELEKQVIDILKVIK